MRTHTFSFEVIMVPVSDVERALRFYVDQVGFTLDVDYSPNDAFRVVQLTPPGSSCSIQIGYGQRRTRRFTSQRLSGRHGPRGRAEPSARAWGPRRGDPAQDAHWSLGWRFRTRARPSAGGLCQLRQLLRSGWANSWVLQERGYRNV